MRKQVREEQDGEQHPPVRIRYLNPKSVTAQAVAALLCCLVGYIAYLQLPAPVIPIDARPVNQAHGGFVATRRN